MSGGRRYTAGVRAALFVLSRGRCYAPGCRQQVLRIVEGEPSITIHIAHIRAHKLGGPRYDDTMTEAQRRGFANLLLLCKPHHDRVDDKAREDEYPKELLLDWKYAREGGHAGDLAALDVTEPVDLQRLFTDSIAQVRAEVMTMLDRVETISGTSASLLRVLVEESFDRPYLNVDVDAIYSLEQSARILMNLEDNAAVLGQAATGLQHLDADTVYGLKSAADELKAAIDSAYGVSADIGQATQELAVAARSGTRSDSSGAQPGVTYYIDGARRWAFFFRGTAVGAGLMVALVLAVLITRAAGS